MTLTADDLSRPRIADELNTILARLETIEKELHPSTPTDSGEGTTPTASTLDLTFNASKSGK